MARARFERDVMSRRLEGWAPEMLAGVRILVGVLFAYDGVQKLLHVFGGMPEASPAAIVLIAGGIELCGGALMAQRLFARAVPDESNLSQ